MINRRWRVILLGIVLLGAAGAVLVSIFQALLGESYIEGKVVDSTTGQPLPGTAVMVSNRGWGFIDGQLVWDKDYIYRAVCDQEGKFRIVFRVGSSAHLKATQTGYQPYDDWHDRNTTVTVKMIPLPIR